MKKARRASYGQDQSNIVNINNISPVKKRTKNETTTQQTDCTNTSWLSYYSSSSSLSTDGHDHENYHDQSNLDDTRDTASDFLNTSANSYNDGDISNRSFLIDSDENLTEDEYQSSLAPSESLIFDSPFAGQLPSSLSTLRSPPKSKTTPTKSNVSSLVSPTKYLKASNFVCQNNGGRVNHNEHLTSVMEKLQSLSEAEGDHWRQYAYKKAVSILRALPFRVNDAKQISHIRGIGAKILDKIREILHTGTLLKVERALADTTNISRETLSKIHGAGPETVRKWIAKGIDSLDKLQQAASKDQSFLTWQQRIGLKYYDDFQLRIPRDEVQAIADNIQAVAKEIDKDIIMQVCGSFRRSKPDCGDIDILFTQVKGEILKGFLWQLVKRLESNSLLTDHLTHVKSDSDKYMGVCRHGPNGKHRRIDFQTIPREEWPYALLYFTGSDHFNRSMRLWARKNGFSLSSSHLVRRWGTGDNEVKGDPIEAATERDIFLLLGLEYKEPHEREV
ncbi:hypothetical protein SAMD00019534_102760 [Acytostelium subglobosum LB1]|uniref:hypothetical protein n=1 Tax=Acytostelium subglobosum LB1 TaxID=1410327 RepID=UPI0006449E47|nr:hypothetical protein SAMD00019534_102760 [Acytostelium subglobosum LB1]GAM27101.1 hypothetical protein SAMD00019534_102760 [Acytostelium subglobosum LB1]|eukprot:XP_012749981.1 hypothetical protein SAMD00019534_102760 [Acytostelium subglobosum LB1]